MNTTVIEEFQKIISQYFNVNNEKIVWEDFDSEWKKIENRYQDLISLQEKDLLKDIHEELNDIISHMPGVVGNSEIIDWRKWTDDDEYLKFLISRESLRLPLSSKVYREILRHSIKSSVFKRPYEDIESFRSEIFRFLSGYC